MEDKSSITHFNYTRERLQNLNVHYGNAGSADGKESDSNEAVESKNTVEREIKDMRAADLDSLLNQHFKGRVVRKDLTKQLKEGANVPVYVLEYLLGMYCASDDEEVVYQGLENVKRILAENYVRPDEAEKVKSLIRERGTFKIIDKVSVDRLTMAGRKR